MWKSFSDVIADANKLKESIENQLDEAVGTESQKGQENEEDVTNVKEADDLKSSSIKNIDFPNDNNLAINNVSNKDNIKVSTSSSISTKNTEVTTVEAVPKPSKEEKSTLDFFGGFNISENLGNGLSALQDTAQEQIGTGLNAMKNNTQENGEFLKSFGVDSVLKQTKGLSTYLSNSAGAENHKENTVTSVLKQQQCSMKLIVILTKKILLNCR